MHEFILQPGELRPLLLKFDIAIAVSRARMERIITTPSRLSDGFDFELFSSMPKSNTTNPNWF
jgi:hypothetical protein